MRIPINAAPYIRLAKRLLRGPGSLEEAAFQKEILCPEQKTTIPNAVFLPGQLDKLIKQKPGAWGLKTKEEVIAEATSTTVTHAPTIAYHIKDATLFDGTIYVDRFKQPISATSLFRFDSGEPRQIEACALASSFLGTKYFGHWMTDDCTRYLLAERFGTTLCTRMPAYPHLHHYQRYFNQTWVPTDRAHIDHLIVFQDFSQNSFKRERYKILRNRIKAYFPEKFGNTLIYLRRGNTGAPRTIQNEPQIMDALTKLGFVIVDIEFDSLEHIIGTLLNARLVVSIEGSHVAHCAYTVPESSGLLILQPSDSFSAVHRDWSESLGIRFGFVVGDVGDKGYQFPVPEILRTIELLMNNLST